MKKNSLICILFFICFGLQAKTYKVGSVEEYNAAVKQILPGDSIVLLNQVWRSVNLVFKGEGTKEKPITLTVQTLGQCTIEGESSLRLSGNYLVVDGLVFVNGYTPSGSVVEFKTSAAEAARNCTLKRCVIDHFNNPEKTKSDHWINLWGQHNAVEYCYFAGKKNHGTTFIVSPNGKGHTENYHRVYRNYFGPRPKLGANGGETLRIGTSTYSLENSNTIVEGNYFEHCNGETEIISVKSCENKIIDNTFWECEGSIVLRHGNRNEISGNYILGNGKSYTGGIRIINKGHKVFNNYLFGLAGVDFRAPLVIMNAVPNSPINRYHQVSDVDVSFNTFVNCKSPWQLCVGSDAERTDRPVNVRIANNIVYSPEEEDLIMAFDKTDGFTFVGNVLQSTRGIERGTGCIEAEIKVRRGQNGIILPLVSADAAQGYDFVQTDIDGRERGTKKSIGAFELAGKKGDKVLAGKSNCGPGFIWKPASGVAAIPKVYQVKAGVDNLYKAIQRSAAGDIIELQDEAEYVNTKKMTIEHKLTIRAQAGLLSRPIIKMDNVTANVVSMFELKPGADFRLEEVSLSGNAKSQKPTKYGFITSKEGNLDPYKLFIDQCTIDGFNVKDGGCVFKAQQTSFADTIQITNSMIRDSFRGFSLADEKEDKGHYNVEYFILKNTTFKNIDQWAINFYRGGNDESTLGGFLAIDHCVFDNVNNMENQMMIKQTGWVNIILTNTLFCNSALTKGPIRLLGAHNKMTHCCIYNAGKVSKASGATTNNIGYEKSSLNGKATDGGNIGLINK